MHKFVKDKLDGPSVGVYMFLDWAMLIYVLFQSSGDIVLVLVLVYFYLRLHSLSGSDGNAVDDCNLCIVKCCVVLHCM